jgi:hypothetical protein
VNKNHEERRNAIHSRREDGEMNEVSFLQTLSRRLSLLVLPLLSLRNINNPHKEKGRTSCRQLFLFSLSMSPSMNEKERKDKGKSAFHVTSSFVFGIESHVFDTGLRRRTQVTNSRVRFPQKDYRQ